LAGAVEIGFITALSMVDRSCGANTTLVALVILSTCSTKGRAHSLAKAKRCWTRGWQKPIRSTQFQKSSLDVEGMVFSTSDYCFALIFAVQCEQEAEMNDSLAFPRVKVT